MIIGKQGKLSVKEVLIAHRMDWVGFAFLGVVFSLFFVKNAEVGEFVREAGSSEESAACITDPFECTPLLFKERSILERLVKDYPKGVPVDLPYDNRHARMMHQFWMALLPEFPIHLGADIKILAADRVTSKERVIERGDLFVLVRGKKSK